MKVPDIFQFQSYELFFGEFLRLNQTSSKAFSYRSLARRLKWPHSYLPDIMHGRKRLTITRAIEFGQFAKLTSFEMERLIYFAMLDPSSPHMNAYFQKRLKAEQSPDLPPATVTIEDSTIQKEDFDLLPFAIFEILVWANGKISPSEIQRLLFTFDDLGLKQIEAAIKFLLAKKIIRCKSDGTYEFPRKMIFMHSKSGKPNALSQHRKMAENFIRFLSRTRGPFTYNSGLVQLPRAESSRILDRIAMLRNWFEQLNQEALDNPSLTAADKLIFQYDLNLFPIIDP